MIDAQKLRALTDAMRGGSDIETACHFAGLSSTQVLKWLEVGKNESERRANGLQKNAGLDKHVGLWDALKKARADAIVRNVTQIQRAASEGQWQAAAWWLERTVPEQYAKKTAKRVVPPNAIEGNPPKQLPTED